MKIFAVKRVSHGHVPSKASLMSLLTEENRNRVIRFRNWEDAERVIIADLMVRYLISQIRGCNINDIVIERDSYGKPFLQNMGQLHFNVSHSGNWVVCTIDSHVVGIDVEHIRPIEMEELAWRFFSKEEYQDMVQKPLERRLEYFYDLWTLKESFVKAEGKGLLIPLNHFTFKIQDNQVSVKHSNDEYNHRYFFKRYFIEDDYRMSVCGCTPDFPSEVQYLDRSFLFQETQKLLIQ
ncbi:4'-phosphopantetheinyl transferase family protein [Paenibacillus glycinis]|uniref:4'-phosphopantetheinyl transferase superfamily protein n=1 Tax=Paenibacillus glycinis TaxID=2697035 RepID=A0ABW9XWP7_9BACL|nr:4'-phosphopantetheinyl transferase superfamily protein [Paenibacillus glycinis]NBD27025.1 4'-phosphopantetheinyl transferase superfamily protein [Paenibacillus glycinis]